MMIDEWTTFIFTDKSTWPQFGQSIVVLYGDGSESTTPLKIDASRMGIQAVHFSGHRQDDLDRRRWILLMDKRDKWKSSTPSEISQAH
jgi:hypothetical protein